MRINTRDGSVELLKQERKTLADCKALLVQIAKHGSEELAESADQGADYIGVVEATLGINGVTVASARMPSVGDRQPAVEAPYL